MSCERGTLPEQGYRFVMRAGEFNWTHPALMKPGDVDCTDMDDQTFEALVAAQEGSK